MFTIKCLIDLSESSFQTESIDVGEEKQISAHNVVTYVRNRKQLVPSLTEGKILRSLIFKIFIFKRAESEQFIWLSFPTAID